MMIKEWTDGRTDADGGIMEGRERGRVYDIDVAGREREREGGKEEEKCAIHVDRRTTAFR